MLFFNNFFYFLPEIFLLVFIIAIIFYSIFSLSFFFKKDKKPILVFTINYMVIFILFCFFLLFLNHYNFFFIIFNFSYISNFSIFFIKILIILSSIIFFLLLFPYFFFKKIVSYEFLVILLFSIFAMLILISSNDFLLMYLCLELQSLCFYILASFKRKSFFSSEAGLKYFILGSLSSGFLLFSISIIFGCTGLLNFIDLEYFFFFFNFNFFFFCSEFFFLSLFFFFSGLFFKLSLAPFHNWTLDVFEGSSIVITCFFAVISKIPVFFLILNFYFKVFFSIFFDLQFFLFFCCILSIIIGVIGALEQNNIKRLFGYITIFSAGFLMLGLLVNNVNGIFASIFYLFSSTLLLLNIFSILLSFFNSKFFMLREVKDLSIFFKANTLVSIFLMFNFFSISGLPPFLGFFSKFFLIYSLLQDNFILLSIFIVIASLVNFYIFLKLIKYLFFFQQKNFFFFFDFQFFNTFFFIFLSFFNILFFLTPNFFINLFINFSLYLSF